MSNGHAFSVFPPPRIPRIAMPNPHIRKPSLMTVDSPANIKESVVIALQEITVPKIRDDYTPKARIQNVVAELSAETYSSAFKNGVPPPPPAQKPSSRTNKMATEGVSSSNQASPDPGSISSSDTLVRPASEEEPVVPIRSMFPTYNPRVPLSQQNYYPRQPVAAYSPEQQTTDAFPPSARAFPVSSVRGSVRSRTNHASVVDVPLDVLNFKEPTYSSLKELERLWDATYGTEQYAAASSFDMEMGRLEEATFTFGSSPDIPFYTATTYDTSEISITKTCPRKRTVVCDIILSSIESPARREAPNDGLVSFIFPKMAAMLAINQSSAIAEEGGLDPTDRDGIQEAAIKRAAIQEASNLRWNAANERYELEHPAIARKNRDPNFVASPQSPQAESTPVLHITVAIADQSMRDLPIILVTYPASLRSPTFSTRTGMVSPTYPEPATDVQLASLDFNTNTLHIEANQILQLMPSLFAVDSIVSALISVAIADPDANAAMGTMKIWTPKLPNPDRSSVALSQNLTGTPRSGAFFATIAEREEAEEEARVAAKSYKKGRKSKAPSTRLTDLAGDQVDIEVGRTWYGKSKVKKQRKKKQIVIGEFDLEKLTHYQSGSRQGQELPAITIGALTAMVSTLKFVVWIMTMVVQFLAWILVGISRGVTSEKF